MATAVAIHPLDTINFFRAFINRTNSVKFNAPYTKLDYGTDPRFDEVYNHLNAIYKKYAASLQAAVLEVGKLKEHVECWNAVDKSSKELLPSLEIHKSSLETMKKVVEYLEKYRDLSRSIEQEFKTGITYFERKLSHTKEVDENSKLLEPAQQNLLELKTNFTLITTMHDRFVQRLDHNAIGYLKTFEDTVKTMENPPKGWFQWFGRKSEETESTSETPKAEAKTEAPVEEQQAASDQ